MSPPCRETVESPCHRIADPTPLRERTGQHETGRVSRAPVEGRIGGGAWGVSRCESFGADTHAATESSPLCPTSLHAPLRRGTPPGGGGYDGGESQPSSSAPLIHTGPLCYQHCFIIPPGPAGSPAPHPPPCRAPRRGPWGRGGQPAAEGLLASQTGDGWGGRGAGRARTLPSSLSLSSIPTPTLVPGTSSPRGAYRARRLIALPPPPPPPAPQVPLQLLLRAGPSLLCPRG